MITGLPRMPRARPAWTSAATRARVPVLLQRAGERRLIEAEAARKGDEILFAQAVLPIEHVGREFPEAAFARRDHRGLVRERRLRMERQRKVRNCTRTDPGYRCSTSFPRQPSAGLTGLCRSAKSSTVTAASAGPLLRTASVTSASARARRCSPPTICVS